MMQIELSESAQKHLQYIQTQTGDSVAEHVVETALALSALLLEKHNEGYTIILNKKGAEKLQIELAYDND